MEPWGQAGLLPIAGDGLTKRYVSWQRGENRLAAQFPHDGVAYTNAEMSFCWEIIHRADDWAQQTGWEPGPSDA
jgi:hypothetical protein